MAMYTYNYSVVTGIFKHDDPTVDTRTFDVYAEDAHFGLLLRDWAKLRSKVEELQKKAAPNVSYKVLYLARHGKGEHNRVEEEYPSNWKTELSSRFGDGKITWGPDPHLTAEGKAQATDAGIAWRREIEEFGLPIPEIFISSPLRRSADTLILTWENIVSLGEKVRPVIVECWREIIGGYTSEMRRPGGEIKDSYPNFELEEGFSMANCDEYWTSTREQEPEVDLRARKALDDVFKKYPDNTYVIITAHCGIFLGALRVLRHRKVRIPTGGMVPVVVCAERNDVPSVEGQSSDVSIDAKRHHGDHKSFPHRVPHHPMKKIRRQH